MINSFTISAWRRFLIVTCFFISFLCSKSVYGQEDRYSRTYNGGIGLLMGEPSGITAKKYLKRSYYTVNYGWSVYKYYVKTRAVQFSLLGNAIPYKMAKGDMHFTYLKEKLSLSGMPLTDFSFKNRISVGLDILFGKDLFWKEWLPQGYFGIGVQYRQGTIDYNYTDSLGTQSAKEKINEFGWNVILGIEYQISFTPISIIGEVKPFITIDSGNILVWPQYVFGIRYCFTKRQDTEYCEDC